MGKLSKIVRGEEYEELVKEIKATLTERIFNARLEKIYAYHEIGGLILNVKSVSTDNLDDLAEDTGVSTRSLYRAVQFAKEEPDVEKFLRGQNKNISINKIFNQYLIKGKIEDCKGGGWVEVCRYCRKQKINH